jgi:hypothetical protein
VYLTTATTTYHSTLKEIAKLAVFP